MIGSKLFGNKLNLVFTNIGLELIYYSLAIFIMQMNPIGWIDLPAVDLDRAEKFYGDFFGFEFQRQKEHAGYTMSWFPMEMKVYGSGITLMKGEGHEPAGSKGPLLYFTAPEGSVSKALEKANSMGIKVIRECQAAGENAEHGYFAIIEDSEGNYIAIHSMQK